LLAGVGWAYALEAYAPLRVDRLKHVRRIAGILIVFGVANLIFRCVKIDHDPYARFCSRFHSELKLEFQPGDRIIVRNSRLWDANVQWYIRRFGDRVTELREGDPIPQAERLWVVTWGVYSPPREAHRQLIDAAKGWKPQETFTYFIRPETANNDTVWWYMCITCLVQPGDTRPPSLLNVSP
jgi:hypothetical protein